MFLRFFEGKMADINEKERQGICQEEIARKRWLAKSNRGKPSDELWAAASNCFVRVANDRVQHDTKEPGATAVLGPLVLKSSVHNGIVVSSA